MLTQFSLSVSCRRVVGGLLGVLLGLAGCIAPVSAQERAALPSERHASLQATTSIPVETLPSVDGAALRAEAEEQSDEIGPYRYGKALETDFSPDRHGSWEQLPSGDWLWRLRIQSREAKSLNLAFTRFQLPAEAKLFVHGPNDEVVHGPYDRTDATQEQLWTPIVPGSEAVVELTVPKDNRSEVTLNITKVSHGFRSLHEAVSKQATAKAQACNIDVACSQANPWNDQVRSVGLYSINGVDACSGSLINNTSQDGTPYFLTAEHCLQGSESAAASMVFYWNYEHPDCRAPGSDESGTETSVDKTNETSSGAILRMSYGNCEDTSGPCYPEDMAGKPDVTLVEIDETIPPKYNLFFNGWDRTDFAPSQAVSIHHPSTHGKRITFEYDPTSITGLESPSNDTHIEVEWDDGTTERGSSGGPLFDSSQHVVGVLSAGGSGCEIRDWFGRIHNAWEGGGTMDTRLRDWLDPLNTGARTMEGMNLSNDSIPPAPIPTFTVENVTADSVTLRWTAPGDDGMEGTAHRYLLRYRTSTPQHQTDVSFESDDDFENAERVSSLPTPDSAGTPQSVTVAVNQDSSYYFALVALDEVGNASQIATVSRDVTPVSSLQVTAAAPNPARTRTVFHAVTEETQRVRASLYDALGRQISRLFDDEVPSFRRQRISVDVSSLSSGMYFVRVQTNNGVQTRKISVVK